MTLLRFFLRTWGISGTPHSGGMRSAAARSRAVMPCMFASFDMSALRRYSCYWVVRLSGQFTYEQPGSKAIFNFTSCSIHMAFSRAGIICSLFSVRYSLFAVRCSRCARPGIESTHWQYTEPETGSVDVTMVYAVYLRRDQWNYGRVRSCAGFNERARSI